MPYRGRKSLYAKQRRWLSRFISLMSYRDPRGEDDRAESVNRVSPEEQWAAIIQEFKVDLTPRHAKPVQAIILASTKGDGVNQW